MRTALRRVALVVPPQWDPRVPSLAVPVLAGHLRRSGVDVHTFDANQALYAEVCHGDPAGAALAERLGEPQAPADPCAYTRLAELAEDRMTAVLAAPKWRLGFSDLAGDLSPDRSADWRLALTQPHRVPFLRHLRGVVTEVAAAAPDLIGITVLADAQLFAALALAATFRRKLPDACIVLGGQALRARRAVLDRVPWLFEVIDGVGVGDGEPLFSSLLNGDDPAVVPNLVWCDGERVRAPAVLQPHRFADHESPDFRGMAPADALATLRTVPIETARGCPWAQCIYCNRPDHPAPDVRRAPAGDHPAPKGYRAKPLAAVAREVRAAAEAGAQRIAFVDEAMSGPHLVEVAGVVTAAAASCGRPLAWYAYARPDETHDQKTMATIAAAGCRKLFVGVETGSARVLQATAKGTTAATILGFMQAAAHAGLALHLFLMTGFPGENQQDRDVTAALLQEGLAGAHAFGLTYDVFPALAELSTPWYHAVMERRHAAGAGPCSVVADGALVVDPRFDLAYRFRPDDPAATPAMLRETATAWRQAIDAACGDRPGLRHLRIGQDALHVAFLEHTPGR